MSPRETSKPRAAAVCGGTRWGQYGLSERHACRLLGPWRGSERYTPIHWTDEDALTRAIVALASQYGRYGYGRITALLWSAGWRVGKDRVQCIWRREGLKVSAKQTPRGRLWLQDRSCDAYTRECLAIRVARRLGSPEVLGARTLYITPGSPWENGYCESFSGQLRDECVNGEIFYSLKKAQIVIEWWRVQYNTRRPHASLGYRPPAPEAYHPVVATNAIRQYLAVM